jgi:hypothetical protein
MYELNNQMNKMSDSFNEKIDSLTSEIRKSKTSGAQPLKPVVNNNQLKKSQKYSVKNYFLNFEDLQ